MTFQIPFAHQVRGFVMDETGNFLHHPTANVAKDRIRLQE
jgi:hypothetical protein